MPNNIHMRIRRKRLTYEMLPDEKKCKYHKITLDELTEEEVVEYQKYLSLSCFGGTVSEFLRNKKLSDFRPI